MTAKKTYKYLFSAYRNVKDISEYELEWYFKWIHNGEFKSPLHKKLYYWFYLNESV